MNAKCYKVWRVLLDDPSEWKALPMICDTTGLTIKQAVSILTGLDNGVLEKEKDRGTLMVRLNMVDFDVEQIRKDVIRDYYKIDEEIVSTLYNSLSPIGWVSITDISQDTGLKVNTISAALSIMDDVIKTVSGHTNLYARGTSCIL